MSDNLPQYVSLGGFCLCLKKGRYYRHAGQWYIGARIVDGRLIADATDYPKMNHVDGEELVEVTEEKWRLDNCGYV